VSSRVLWELQSGLSVLRMEPGNPILHVMVIHERLKMAAILVLVLTELLATEHWEQAETGTLELTEADLRVLEVTTEIRDPGTMEDRETTTVEDRGMEVMEVNEAIMVEVRDLRTIEANKTTAATTGDLSRTTTTTTTDPGQLQL